MCQHIIKFRMTSPTEHLAFQCWLAHPLPWRLEQDWTTEVIASDGYIVAKCSAEDAQKVIEWAESMEVKMDQVAKEIENELLEIDRTKEAMDEIREVENHLKRVFVDSAKERLTGKGELTDSPRGTPTDEQLPDGQFKDHWVLSEEERAKGFVRPVRNSYVHVGIPGPTHTLRDLTEEQEELFGDSDYVKFEAYPESEHATGRFWTQAEIDSISQGCGAETIMSGRGLSETYAREPQFYGSTFCTGCGDYLPVGKQGEFVWSIDETRVGT